MRLLSPLRSRIFRGFGLEGVGRLGPWRLSLIGAHQTFIPRRAAAWGRGIDGYHDYNVRSQGRAREGRFGFSPVPFPDRPFHLLSSGSAAMPF